MFYQSHEWTLEPNMVMFAQLILMNSDTGNAMCLGRTYLVTGGTPETL